MVKRLFQQKTELSVESLQLPKRLICVLFSQKNMCDQSENILEYTSILQKNKNNSLSARKNFPVPAKYTLKELLLHSGQKPHFEGKYCL